MTYARTQLANNVNTTLSSSATDVATSVSITSATGFPTFGDYYIAVGSEVMLVTNVSGTTLTVTRGVEGTTAAAHASGAAVKIIVNASLLEEYFRDSYILGPSYARNSITNPDTGLRLTASDFTWVNQGTATATDRDNSIILELPTSATTQQARGLFITAPSPPYSVVMGFRYFGPRGGFFGFAPFTRSVLTLRRSGGANDGKMMSMSYMPRSDNPVKELLQVVRMTDENTVASEALSVDWHHGNQLVWYKIEDDNTDLNFSFSVNGKDFDEVHSESRTSFISDAPNQVGFMLNSGGQNTYKTMMEVFHFGSG